MAETTLDEEEEKQKQLNEVIKQMKANGLGCGDEIAQMALEIHPGCTAIPLYRGAMVIEQGVPQEGAITLHFYHDPHWMGDELTVDALRRYKTGVLVITGQRSGANVFVPKDNKADFEDAVEVPLSFDRLKAIFEKDDEDGLFFVLSRREDFYKKNFPGLSQVNG